MTCQDESFNKDLKKLHYCVFVELFLSVKAAFLPCGDVTLAGSSQLSTPEFHTKVGKKTAKTRCCMSAAAATAPHTRRPPPGAVSSPRCLEAPWVGVRVWVQVGVQVGVGFGVWVRVRVQVRVGVGVRVRVGVRVGPGLQLSG